MKRLRKGSAGFIIVLCFLSCLVAGEDSSADKTSSIKLGYEERARFVSWNNLYLYDQSQETRQTFIRFRTRLSLVWAASKSVELGLRVANEFRYYFVPTGKVFNLHEGFIDNLYLKWTGPASFPVILTLGRQNMTLGEGFLVNEGNPADELRSSYFNALRADVRLQDNSRLTLFFAYQPDTDELLPIINARNQLLVEQPEKGLGAYFSGNYGRFDLDGYLIHKTIRATESLSQSSRFQTLGARAVVRFVKMLSFSAEGAYQFGSIGEADRRAFGGYTHLDYEGDCLTCPLQRLSLGFVYLSGDDPDTETWEAWDPVFGRWLLWSESYAYTLGAEQGGRFAYWTNLISIFESVTIGLAKNVRLSLSYQYLLADKLPDRIISHPEGSGKTRGGLAALRFDWEIRKNLTAHVLWETFSPDSYYSPDASRTQWLRFELVFKI